MTGKSRDGLTKKPLPAGSGRGRRFEVSGTCAFKNLLDQEINHAGGDKQNDGGQLHAAGVPPQMFSLPVLNHLLRLPQKTRD